jgi:hypothetical protein
MHGITPTPDSRLRLETRRCPHLHTPRNVTSAITAANPRQSWIRPLKCARCAGKYYARASPTVTYPVLPRSSHPKPDDGPPGSSAAARGDVPGQRRDAAVSRRDSLSMRTCLAKTAPRRGRIPVYRVWRARLARGGAPRLENAAEGRGECASARASR